MLQLSDKDRAIVMDIFRTHAPAYRVWAYGSRARGDARRFSDLDLLAKGKKPMDFGTHGELMAAFAESDLPFRVDVIDRRSVSDQFFGKIEKDLVPLG